MRPVTRAADLGEWLALLEHRHPQAIDLGLDRVRQVAQRLGLLHPRSLTLTVAGTNGKGSSVSLAAEIYRQAGYHVGRYLSPHLLHYRERVAIDGVEASDDALCAAFAAVEAMRGDVSLTYFETGTLAALWLFAEARVDVQVLEVGLGGRLDAVNIVDADCALITPIGLDHTDWLGPDRDSIGYEKAGIARAGRPAVIADPEPPQRLLDHLRAIGARPVQLGEHYRYERESVDESRGPDPRWKWWRDGRELLDLPLPALIGAAQIGNAAGVIAAVDRLGMRLPVSAAAIQRALPALRLRGRFECVGRLVLDVAHNAESASVLADNLRAAPVAGRTHLVLAMLADKPVTAVAQTLVPLVDTVFVAPLPPPRGLDAATLAARLAEAGIDAVACASVEAALRLAQARSGPQDRIVVTGSFLTVAAAAAVLDERNA